MKYQDLLKGLEIAEVTRKNAVNPIGESRWDSEYYQKLFVEDLEKINRLPHKKLSNYAHFIRKGIFDMSPDYYQNNGIPFIRTSEIKDPTVNFSTTVFLSKETNSQYESTFLRPNDLVFTKIGAYIGDVALLPPIYPLYNFSQNVAGVSLKDSNDGCYLLAFLLTHFGQNQIKRSAMLSGQGKLELNDLRNYLIPNISKILQKGITDIIEKSIKLKGNSGDLMKSATSMLMKELKLMDWTYTNEPVSVKTYKAVLSNRRWDAEYYQPKYDDMLNRIQGVELVPLHKIVHINKSIEPGSDLYEDSGVPFVRVSDLSEYGISMPDIYLDKEIFHDVIRPKKDTILLSKDGSVGIAYKVQEDLDVITSGAILHLAVFNTEFLPDYLTLVLNSIVVRMQAERDAGGSVIQHWKPSEIEQVLIPKLDIEKQQEITNQVQESFKLRSESKRLLEVAKKAVEIAIEENEENALKYINEYGKSLYDK